MPIIVISRGGCNTFTFALFVLRARCVVSSCPTVACSLFRLAVLSFSYSVPFRKLRAMGIVSTHRFIVLICFLFIYTSHDPHCVDHSISVGQRSCAGSSR
ncbi:hypothetical protein K458DRAFT_65900 [Lentithecium fluviatile CBS 122367]|uniref:Uncharacterized protein n=1 Tax=Lentithecium fluviatile CBS 122367 TaxID=1168545 RepID=A0A6G1JLI8_9PLEO|nr:hypothetical protein K458DRAFT_65900 [Lentithecium fluviatile CBS 122367]